MPRKKPPAVVRRRRSPKEERNKEKKRGTAQEAGNRSRAASCGLSLSELGEVLADVAPEGHGAAAGHAGDKVRVRVGKVAAAVVADNIKTRDRLAFRVDGIHVRVDLNAVHRAQNVARVLGAVEGRLVKGRHAEGFLAVVKVVAVPAHLVVALDGGGELFGRQTQLTSEIFDRVGLHQEALFEQHREVLLLEDLPGDVGVGAVFKRNQARAAVHPELSDVLGPVAVKERVVAAALLIFVGVQNGFVRARFVDEAVTVGVDLEPGLGGHPEHTHVARLGRFGAVGLIRAQSAAVELHGRVRVVHLGADPQAGADAVAVSAGHRAVAADHAQSPGLQSLKHLVVERVAARGQQHALGGVVAHVLAVLVDGDAARDAAVLAFELDHAGVVVKAGALLDAVVKKNLVAVQRLARAVVARSPARRVACQGR